MVSYQHCPALSLISKSYLQILYPKHLTDLNMFPKASWRGLHMETYLQITSVWLDTGVALTLQ